MKQLMKILAGLVGGITALVLALALILWAKPPELIRIGANYTAKMVCSNVYLAGRDPREVLQTDVQAPGHPLLELMRASVDMNRGIVRAGIFGFIGGGVAVARPDVGCVAVPDGKLPTAAPSDQVPVHLPRVGAKWHDEIDAARSRASGQAGTGAGRQRTRTRSWDAMLDWIKSWQT